MVTSYNPKDLVKFANYCINLYEIGIKKEGYEITKEDFDNWKVGKSFKKQISVVSDILTELHVPFERENTMSGDYLRVKTIDNSTETIHFANGRNNDGKDGDFIRFIKSPKSKAFIPHSQCG